MANGSGQNIIDKILADAKAQAKEITNAAKADYDTTVGMAKQKAEKETSAALKIAQDEAAKAASKEISAAEMQAKKMILEQKQACLEEVISIAKEKLKSLSDDEYKVILFSMLDKAIANKGSEIIFSAKDKANLQKEATAKGFKISDETRNIEGGFIVKKGDIEYNYSFESIISVEKEEIEQIAAEILFA
ncbi:MAG: V-type ATP synthase subunit E [Lachnospiraceae bacterium]|nr:V-type ATP synthase subunit E [Lachnospiraceae bacterium]